MILCQFIGAAQCLGELYRYFGRRITSGLLETTSIVTKLLKFSEVSKCKHTIVHPVFTILVPHFICQVQLWLFSFLYKVIKFRKNFFIPRIF